MIESSNTAIPDKRVKKRQKSEFDNNMLTAAKGGGMSFIGQLFAHVLGIVFVMILARLLGSEKLGVYRLSLSVVGVIGALCHLGLAGGMTRFIPIARKENDDAKIWGIVQVGVGIPAVVGLVASFFVFVLAESISVKMFNKPGLIPILRIASLSIPLTVFIKSLAAIAQGYKQIQYEVYAEQIFFNILKLILSVAVILWGFGIAGVTLAYVIAEAISLGLLFYFVSRIFSFKRPISSAKRNTRELFNFSIPLFLSQFLNQFGRRFELLILGIFGVIMEVGVYSAILSLSMIGNMGYIALRKISSPIFAELHSQSKFEELSSFYQLTTKWALTFNLPFLMTILLFSDNLLLVYGKDFTLGSMGLIVLAFGTFINSSTGASGSVINMSGYSKITFYNSIIYMATTLILDLILIPKWRLLGAAWAGSLTIIIVNLIRVIQVYKLLNGLFPFNRSFFKPIGASLFAGGLAYWLSQFVFTDRPILQFVLLGSLVWLVYIATIIALKLSPEDRLIVSKVWNRFRFKSTKKSKKRKKRDHGDLE